MGRCRRTGVGGGGARLLTQPWNRWHGQPWLGAVCASLLCCPSRGRACCVCVGHRKRCRPTKHDDDVTIHNTWHDIAFVFYKMRTMAANSICKGGGAWRVNCSGHGWTQHRRFSREARGHTSVTGSGPPPLSPPSPLRWPPNTAAAVAAAWQVLPVCASTPPRGGATWQRRP